MSGGSQQTSSQTTSSAPWPPSQGHLKGILGEAKDLFKSGAGFTAYGTGNGKKPWTEFSGQTQDALGQMQNIAGQGNPFYSGQASFNKGLLGGQYNLDQSGYRDLMGGGPNTEGDYRSMMGAVNPEFENVVQSTANDVGDQIQRQFGGASYGSASNADYLTRGVGDVVSRMRSDNFYNNANLERGLLNDITGVQQQQFNNQRGLLGDMSNLSNLDIQNRIQGLDRADSTYMSQYLPSQMLADVGSQYDAKNKEILQAKIDRYNINQMAPWDRLTQYFGIASGTGAQGNRATTSVSQPTDPWSKLLGGGLLASQLFS